MASAAAAGANPRGVPGWSAYLRDPRSAVLFFLASALLVGGGRKGWQAIRARRAVAALAGLNPDPADVLAAADHGRAGLIDLFRLLTTAERPEVSAAAGRALARLWRGDELIAEEEKAVVRRGFAATWRARRTYPRGLTAPIDLAIDFGVAFLRAAEGEVGPEHLAWSYRISGTERAGLEAWADLAAGTNRVSFTLFPTDFATLGPHRLSLQARVRTVGLTDAWELDLPHLPFAFEFDPHLSVDALLTLPDEARGTLMTRGVRLATLPAAANGPGETVPVTADLVLRDPPVVVVDPPLPCDLAHRLAVECEGIEARVAAGVVVVAASDLAAGGPLAIPLGLQDHFPAGAIDRPGPRRLRAVLTADPELGWGNPASRSVWPGTITTDWFEVAVIRR